MWEGHAHYAQCHLWANGHRAYEKPGRASNGIQPVCKQCSSTPLPQCPPSFLPGVPALTSLSDRLLAERYRLKETSSFPKYSRSWCLSQQQNENEDRCLSNYPLVSLHMLTKTCIHNPKYMYACVHPHTYERRERERENIHINKLQFKPICPSYSKEST